MDGDRHQLTSTKSELVLGRVRVEVTSDETNNSTSTATTTPSSGNIFNRSINSSMANVNHPKNNKVKRTSMCFSADQPTWQVARVPTVTHSHSFTNVIQLRQQAKYKEETTKQNNNIMLAQAKFSPLRPASITSPVMPDTVLQAGAEIPSYSSISPIRNTGSSTARGAPPVKPAIMSKKHSVSQASLSLSSSPLSSSLGLPTKLQSHGTIRLRLSPVTSRLEGSKPLIPFEEKQVSPTEHTGAILCMKYINKITLLVTGGDDGIVRVWDVSTSQLKHYMEGHTATVLCMEVIPSDTDPELIATGSSDATIRIWDPLKAQCKFVLRGHTNSVVCLQYCSTSHTLGSRTGSGNTINKAPYSGKPLDTGSKGNVLVSGGYDGSIIIWNLEEGSIKQTLLGHTGEVECIHVRYGMIASSADDGTVRVWNLTSGECLQTLKVFNQPSDNLNEDPPITIILKNPVNTTNENGQRREVNSRFCKQVRTSMIIWSCRFAPNSSRLLACGCDEGTLMLWDWQEASCLKRFEGHTDAIMHLLWIDGKGLAPTVINSASSGSPTNGFLISASDDNTLRLWNCDTGECRFVFSNHKREISAITLDDKRSKKAGSSTDEVVLVSGSFDGSIGIWDLNRGVCKRMINISREELNCLVFEKGIFSAGFEDGSFRIDPNIKL